MPFQYVNPHPVADAHGVHENLVFLPGWGFDGRILDLMPGQRRWLAPVGFLDPESALEDIQTCLARLGGKITLVGWSMGGYLALAYASRHPEAIAGLLLLSLRKSWPVQEIEMMKQNLAADPVATMKHFYRRCFLGQKRLYEAFCGRVQDRCLQDMEPDVLDRGLDFLASASVGTLPDVPVHVFHGAKDIVAPLAEIASFPGRQIEVLAGAGHAVFLDEAFALPAERKKRLVRQKFSEAADTYDEYATVQKKVVGLLVKALPPAAKVETLLEIGCGTGNYTARLVDAFPGSRLTAVDFSKPMLDVARQKLAGAARISFVCQDAEAYLADGVERFDFITSNAALQWFDNLPGVLADMARCLRPEGMVLASIFGPATLRELAEALAVVFGEERRLPSQSFPDKEVLRALLEQNFHNIDLHEVTFTRHYHSFRDLLTHIKRTGTTGWQERAPLVFTRNRLQKLDDWFAKRYGGHQLTYQVYIFKGRA